MSTYIDESTHLQLANAAEHLAEELLLMASESGLPLNYQRLAAVNNARELVRVARVQLRNAGVNVGKGVRLELSRNHQPA